MNPRVRLLNWLDKTGRKHRWLAKEVNMDESELCRFLKKQIPLPEKHIPALESKTGLTLRE